MVEVCRRIKRMLWLFYCSNFISLHHQLKTNSLKTENYQECPEYLNNCEENNKNFLDILGHSLLVLLNIFKKHQLKEQLTDFLCTFSAISAKLLQFFNSPS